MEKQTTANFELPDSADGETYGVRVEFCLTRTKIVSLQVTLAGDVLAELEPAQEIGETSPVFDLNWPEPRQLSAALLRVTSEGALPHLAGSEWQLENRAPAAALTADATGEESESSVYQRFLERRLRLRDELRDEGKLRARQFFFEIDFQTFPGVATESPSIPAGVSAGRAEKIRDLRDFLQNRVQERALSMYDNRSLPPETVYQDRSNLRQISTFIRSIAERYFSEHGALRFEPVEYAFEEFAGAILRDQGADGRSSYYEPDSGFYFSFAELAFVSIECGIDVCFWSRLLNAQVRSLEILLRSYPVAPGTGTFVIASRIAPSRYTTEIDREKVAEIRERYAPLTFSQLRRAAAYLAFWAMTQEEFLDANVDALMNWVQEG